MKTSTQESDFRWNFVNKEEAAIKAMEDYKLMKKTVKLIETNYLNGYQHHQQAAKQYMDWFQTSWELLTLEQQSILEAYYMTGNRNSGAAKTLSIELEISESTVHRRKKTALLLLTNNLFE